MDVSDKFDTGDDKGIDLMVDSMNICMIAPWFPSNDQGDKMESSFGIFEFREAKKLMERGHKIFVISIKFPGQPKFEKFEEDLAVFRVQSLIVPLIRYPIPNIFSLLHAIKKKCRDGEIDVLIFRGYEFLTSVPTLFLKKRKIPMVVTVNDISGINWKYGNWFVDSIAYLYTTLLGRHILKAADGIRILGSGAQSYLINIGIKEDDLCFIPRGVDTDMFKPDNTTNNLFRRSLGVDSEDFVILYVGRFDQVKGVDYLLEAVKMIYSEHEKIKLILVGDGNLKDYYYEISEPIRDAVVFTGFRSDIPKFMNMADVVVLPSLSEGCPNVVLEAMACGTPVIASRVGAVPDIIENDRTGVIVEPKDVEGLKWALARLMEDQEFARKMGEQGRKRVEKEFTWDVICRKLEGFYGVVVMGNNGMEVDRK